MAAPSSTKWGSTAYDGTNGHCVGVYVTMSSTNTSVTVSYDLYYWSKYGVSDSNNTFYRAWDNDAWTSLGSKSIKHSVSTGEGWSTSNQTKIGSWSKTYTRGTSSKTATAWGKASGIDVIPKSVSVSKSVTIPAKPSYTVSYNANGGSGAPSSQKKWYGTTLKLSSTKPTRTGYTFLGWSTSSTATSATWSAGGSYTTNASDTLYAVWKANTYTVSYNANGGSGAPANQTKTYGINLTLSSTKPTRTNYKFMGWGTSASSTTVAYAAGATYTTNAAITLYAIWEIAYIPPKITELTADRCDSSGTLQDEGTYIKVGFKWELDSTYSGGLSSITVGYKLSTATSYTNTTVSASGMSGTVSKVIGSGDASTESNYDVQVVVKDDKGSNTISVVVPQVTYIIDFLAGGDGVAFGKPAENEGFEVAMDATFNDKVSMYKNNLQILTTIDPNTTPTANTYADSDMILDSSGNSICYLEAAHYTNGIISAGVVAKRVVNGENKYAHIKSCVSPTGAASYVISDVSAFLTALGIKDFIVESGSSGNWWWEKYNSGRMHMRGRCTQGCKGGSSWGNIFYDSGEKGGWTYPVAFKSIKSATIQVERSKGEFWIDQSTQGTTTTAPKCYVCTGTKNSTSVTCYFHVDTWGTWK